MPQAVHEVLLCHRRAAPVVGWFYRAGKRGGPSRAGAGCSGATPASATRGIFDLGLSDLERARQHRLRKEAKEVARIADRLVLEPKLAERLERAARGGDAAGLRALAAEDPDCVAARLPSGDTALLLAASSGKSETFALLTQLLSECGLLDTGVRVGHQDFGGRAKRTFTWASFSANINI